MGWLPGYERIDLTDWSLTYTGGPYKGVAHSMEGTLESAIQVFTQDPGKASHCAIKWWPGRERRVQFVDLDRSAKALRNLPGGAQTNRDSALQVEMEGFTSLDAARRAHMEELWVGNWPDAAYTALAQWIVDCWKAVGQRFEPHFLWPESRRMTADEYDAYGAVCCHVDIPENDHTDITGLDRERVDRKVDELLGLVQPGKQVSMGLLAEVQTGDGRLEVFRIRSDGELIHRWQTAMDQGFVKDVPMMGNTDDRLGPKNRPGQFTDISAGVTGDGRIHVVGEHATFGIPWHAWQWIDTEAKTVRWSDWVLF